MGRYESIEELVEKYHKAENESVKARLAEQIILQNENLVKSCALKNRGQEVSLEDLIQVGKIALIGAIERYDPARGNKFSTYATKVIDGILKHYLRDKTWSVKVPRHLQEFALKVVKAEELLANQLGRVPSIIETANHLGKTEEQVYEAKKAYLAYQSLPLEISTQLNYDEDMMFTLEMVDIGYEEIKMNEDCLSLYCALERLNPREKFVIQQIFFNESSQTAVAKTLGLSQMQISRIQTKALSRLRELLEGFYQ